MKRIIFSAILFLFVSQLMAQKSGYNIQVKLRNNQDTSILLVSYFGNSNQIIDTAFLNKGSYTFAGKTNLVGGIYLFVFQNKQYLEIIMPENQYFSAETDVNDPINTMVFKNSPENDDFYNYLKMVNKYGKNDREINEQIKAAEGNAALQDSLKSKAIKLSEEVNKTKEDFITAHPNNLFSVILKASRELEIPKDLVLPTKADGTPDSNYLYTYYKQHFFDDFDFSDERLLRTPIYASKIKKYYKNVLVQRPDTLIKESIMMIEKAKANKETYKFNIWYFTYDAESSQIMGMDKVFVELGKKYYISGEAFWMNDKLMERMTTRINTLDRLLIGKTAPNLIMQDTLLNLKSLLEVKAKYTMILFWDPDCGHCKHEIGDLVKWYNEEGAQYNVKVFAVCSDTNMAKMKQKIREYKIQDWIHVDGPRSLTENYHDLYDINSTPILYLLDEKKLILAKKLNAKQTTDFIKRDFEMKKEEKD